LCYEGVLGSGKGSSTYTSVTQGSDRVLMRSGLVLASSLYTRQLLLTLL